MMKVKNNVRFWMIVIVLLVCDFHCFYGQTKMTNCFSRLPNTSGDSLMQKLLRNMHLMRQVMGDLQMEIRRERGKMRR